ncbi:response regulator [Dissulfurispira sp.]|uniref:response regulator n=1 Tax=Dissulfurispira sp. TaxID=2817609 RepID=UPI002FDB6635
MSGKGKIFIIDDDELIVSILEKALTNEGYEVSSLTTTEDAVNKVKAKSPDVIIYWM